MDHKPLVIKRRGIGEKQTHSSMKQSREPQNKPMHAWSINLQQRSQEHIWGKHSLIHKWYWESYTATSKSIKLNHYLTP